MPVVFSTNITSDDLVIYHDPSVSRISPYADIFVRHSFINLELEYNRKARDIDWGLFSRLDYMLGLELNAFVNSSPPSYQVVSLGLKVLSDKEFFVGLSYSFCSMGKDYTRLSSDSDFTLAGIANFPSIFFGWRISDDMVFEVKYRRLVYDGYWSYLSRWPVYTAAKGGLDFTVDEVRISLGIVY